MSFNVLVVAEDFTKDEHILKPIVEQVLRDAGKSRATVQVCRNPNFQGISEATKLERLRDEVVKRYPMVNLFLLFVDADGNNQRPEDLKQLASRLEPFLGSAKFLTEVARQEVEIFPIAGHSLSPDWKWNEIRADQNVKNTWFQELVKREGTGNLPHQGRKKLMAEAMRHWTRIQSRCPEETTQLAQTIKELI